MIPCPNEEVCGGAFRFSVHLEHDGVDEWMTCVGYAVECVERTCSCRLTAEQWTLLEMKAVESASDPDPGIDAYV